MKELRGIATDMVKVYEAQKRIETMYQPKETFSTSEAFSFLRDNYPEALSDMMRHLGAG